ncbi:MAG: hypothetical protein R3C09_08225 [Pirellulaceae bacterium]
MSRLSGLLSHFTLHYEIGETDAAAVNDLLFDDDISTRDEERFGCDTDLRVNARNVMFQCSQFNRVQQHRRNATSLVISRNEQAIQVTRESQVGEYEVQNPSRCRYPSIT